MVSLEEDLLKRLEKFKHENERKRGHELQHITIE